MKKLKSVSAIILLGVLLSPVFCSAQMVGGGGEPVNNTTPVSGCADDGYSAFKFGVILPEGTYAQPYSFGNNYFYNLASPFGGKPITGEPAGALGLGAKTGYEFEYSGFISFSKLQLGANLPARFGMQIGFEGGLNPISWSDVNWSEQYMTVSTSTFLYGGFKIGPQFNINPMENMGICFYATLDPYITLPGGESATYNGSGYNNTYGDYTYTGTYDVKDTTGIHVNIDVSAGINFYYKALLIGIEYNWLHSRYNGAITQSETDTYTNVYTIPTTARTDVGFTSVIQMNMLKFTIGVRFGNHRRGWYHN
jgi:hypothetical protein